MSLYARADVDQENVSVDGHGGCGTPHFRPKGSDGSRVALWELSCPQCEVFLAESPNWSRTISEVPETPDEEKARTDFEKRGAIDRDQVMALAMAKLAGVDLPETMRRPISGLQPHVPVIAGEIVCEYGHPCDAGSKFCAECGSPLTVPAKRTCPDGHEMAAKAKFCGECGQPAGGTRALEAAEVPDLTQPVKSRLKNMQASQLKKIARERGVDDSGTRAEVLARLQAA